MHVYTFIQLIGLAILYTVSYVKSIALAFPFFVLLMLPLRFSLKYLPKISITKKGLIMKVMFNEDELEAVSIFLLCMYGVRNLEMSIRFSLISWASE